MRRSSPSQSHCTQVPIKIEHQKVRKKYNRRKRVDLECGCTYFRSLNCHNHGFTHRGIHHCSSSDEWRIYLGYGKSPVFQDPRPPGQAVPPQPRHHNGPSEVQPQPEESLGDSQMFHNLPDLDSFTSSDMAFLEGLTQSSSWVLR
uniref:Transcriptional activator protein n=1 Tax=Sida leaf curl virus TaxID=337823 RepID=A5H1E3_9GEMI|nr:TrAP protein [Sida leaf curl virus]WEM04221.1 AC2 protein [Sida leaf curl virus]